VTSSRGAWREARPQPSDIEINPDDLSKERMGEFV
jgi:hypothetical protein